MHIYTPSKESLKAEWNRHVMLKKKKFNRRQKIPRNSEPWTQCEYKSIHELLVVVDNIAKVDAQWQIPSKTS